MKAFLLLTSVLLLFACIQTKKISTATSLKNRNKDDFIVYKIDSINDYFLVYAKKRDSLYKIVSKKEKIENCNEIFVNGSYPFKLHSSIYINGKSIIPPASGLEVNGLAYDKNTFIDFEGDSIKDLYYADNIKGLCFIKKK